MTPSTPCLRTPELARQTSRWLGTDAVPRAFTIEVSETSTPVRTIAMVILRDREVVARRIFSPAPEHCDDRHATLSLALALALRASLPDSADASSSAREAKWQLGVRFHTRLSVTPRLTAGGGLMLRRKVRRHFALQGDLLADKVLGRRVTIGEGTLTLRSVAARLAACGVLTHFRGCVGVDGSALIASGSGFSEDARRVVPSASLVSSLGFAIPLMRRWSLDLTAVGLVRLGRTRFDVRSRADTVVARRQLSRAAAELSLGPAYHF